MFERLIIEREEVFLDKEITPLLLMNKVIENPIKVLETVLQPRDEK